MSYTDFYTSNDKHELRIDAKQVVVYLPLRYRDIGIMEVGEHVKTVGIFEYSVDDGPKHGLFLPGYIDMFPSRLDEITLDGEDILRCQFEKGDVFIQNTQVIKTESLAYTLFTEFIEKGRIPSFITYDQAAFLFDTIKELTGSKIPVSHVVFEAIFAYLARDKKDYRIQYRWTDMKNDPHYLKITDSPHATQSLTAKLISGYLPDSINAAVVNETTEHSKIEDVLRN